MRQTVAAALFWMLLFNRMPALSFLIFFQPSVQSPVGVLILSTISVIGIILYYPVARCVSRRFWPPLMFGVPFLLACLFEFTFMAYFPGLTFSQLASISFPGILALIGPLLIIARSESMVRAAARSSSSPQPLLPIPDPSQASLEPLPVLTYDSAAVQGDAMRLRLAAFAVGVAAFIGLALQLFVWYRDIWKRTFAVSPPVFPKIPDIYLIIIVTGLIAPLVSFVLVRSVRKNNSPFGTLPTLIVASLMPSIVTVLHAIRQIFFLGQPVSTLAMLLPLTAIPAVPVFVWIVLRRR